MAYAVVIGALAAIRGSGLGRGGTPAPGRGGMRSTLAEIVRRPQLRWPIVLAGVTGFFTTNFLVSLTAFAQRFHLHAGGYGLLTCSLAVGSLAGALLSARHPGTRLRTLVLLTALVALAQLVAAFMPGPVSLGAAIALTGLVCLPLRIALNSSTQLAAEDATRGRVMGVFVFMVLGAAAAGGPAIGFLAEWGGAPAGLIAGGIVMGAAALFVGHRLARAAR